MKRLLTRACPLSLCSALLLAGCASMSGSPRIAVATLQPTQGNATHGTVSFVQKGLKVVVDARFSNLAPGAHGIHIHERGDCSSPDGQSAGGHFNPSGKLHGGPMTPAHHAGDLGNIIAQADGTATLQVTVPSTQISLNDTAVNSIVGKSVIVHADPDDFASQPSGNSGKRLACGVISLK
ncbi:MAG TPA: superoxide dismutase family protein [Oxalicibacterium sp.]|nr:superoxide dismutase family protein [Oxalicibacterium sp.]